MANQTPRRSTGRVSGVPRRVGRVLEQSVQSRSVYNDSLDVDRDGRLGVKIAKGETGLVNTRQGLMLKPGVVGDKNHDAMSLIKEPASTAAADIHATLLELLAELRRTKRMR